MSLIHLTRVPVRTRRAGIAIAAVAALAALTGVSPASAATTAAAAPVAAACPTGAFAFASTLSNGTFKIGKNASSSGASGTACGSITGDGNGGLLSVVKQDNITFAPSTTKVLFLNLPTTITPTSDLTGPTVLTATGIDVTLSGSVKVTTDVLGQKCSFPLTLNMTTGKSGSLTGTQLVADAATGGQKGHLVAGDFTVPKLKASKTCNVIVAELTNSLLGLPLKAGASAAQFDIALKLGV